MSKKEDERKKDLLKEALDRYKVADEFWSPIIKEALKDIKFVDLLEQWAETDVSARNGRPCLVVDKLGQYCRQVINDARQNRPQPKARPVDSKGDKEVATVLEGMIRHVTDISNADDATDTAVNTSVKGGLGYMRLATEYEDDTSFNQVVRIKRVRNIAAVRLDPYFTEADGSDCKFGFFEEQVPIERFKQEWPKAEKVDFKGDKAAYAQGWLSEHTIKVAEYFYIEDGEDELLELQDGSTTTRTAYDAAVKNGTFGETSPKIARTRTIASPKVKMARISGAEILEEKEWAGIYIPIIPVFGEETDIEGKVSYKGLIRPAKDAQKLYNYSRSSFAERVALTPKAPWVTAEEATDEYDKEWSTANTANHSRLRFKAYDADGRPLPAPTRPSNVDIPAGFAEDMQISEHDIQGALGMYNASLGEKSNEQSGKAILARRKQGDTATFHFPDNLNRAIRYMGRQLVDLIPKIYDTARVVKTLGMDNKPGEAKIDPQQFAPVTRSKDGNTYNLNIGKYDVTVTAGPSYNTMRMEAADFIGQLLQGNPALMQLIGDLFFRNVDMPGADEIADRLHALLPPAVANLDSQDGDPPEVKMVKAQAANALQQQQQMIQQLQQALNEAHQQLNSKTGDLLNKSSSTKIAAYAAETDRFKATMGGMNANDIREIVTELVTQMQNTGTPDQAA